LIFVWLYRLLPFLLRASSSSLRRWCAGIGVASVSTGAGSRVVVSADLRSGRDPRSGPDNGREYFVKRLLFNEDVAPVFGSYLFAPTVCLVRYAADCVRVLQSGHLNFYLGLIGLLLVIILGLALL
jgi:hypothetical protein